MAFCNSCGAELTSGTRFCNKCGAAIVASTPNASTPIGASAAVSSTAPSASGPVAAPTGPASGQSNALKIVLIVVGVIVVAGVLGMAAVGFVAWRIAHHTHVRQEGDNVKVETPFGSVESTKDPDEAARSIGVDVYPGAEVMKDGSSTASFGGVLTTSAKFETSDSFEKVSNFYKSKFPNAIVSTSQSDHCSIVSNDNKKMVTINIHARGDHTEIQIATVFHGSDPSSSNQ